MHRPMSFQYGLTSKGFTLLEVLVALAVLAISLMAVLNNINVHTANDGRLIDKTFAHWVALNKITELQAQKNWPSLGTQKDSTTLAKQKWYWEADISSTEDKNIHRLEVRVMHESNPDRVLDTLLAYIRNPAP